VELKEYLLIKRQINGVYIIKLIINLFISVVFEKFEDAIKARQEKAKEPFGEFLNSCEK
jgi:hypothetical protein